MVKIEITEETATCLDMAYALREIANRIEKGFTRGIDPNFVLSGENELSNNEVLEKWEENPPRKPVWAIHVDLITDPLRPIIIEPTESPNFPATINNFNFETSLPIGFRLRDGDDEIYFLGRMDRWTAENEPFAPLDDYGRAYGCTGIELYKDGSWTEV